MSLAATKNLQATEKLTVHGAGVVTVDGAMSFTPYAGATYINQATDGFTERAMTEVLPRRP